MSKAEEIIRSVYRPEMEYLSDSTSRYICLAKDAFDELAEAKAVLREVEWSGSQTHDACPLCSATKPWADDHHEHCRLAKVLEEK